jgi:diguanylate cyclase (GGDEF)-like protein/PAS domain S-box-containing protein
LQNLDNSFWHALKTRVTVFTLVILVISIGSLAFYADGLLASGTHQGLDHRLLWATLFIILLAAVLTWWMLTRQLLPMLAAADQCRQTQGMLQKLSVAVAQSPASVVITDLNGSIEYVNSRFTQITGYSTAEVLGKNPRILRSMQTSKATYEAMWQQLTSGRAWHGELLNKRKNGELYWEEIQVAPVVNPAGAVTHYVAVKTDITARKQLEEQVRHLAFHDALTQLPNRHLLNDRLRQSMAASKRSGLYGALMFLDLDNFKPLNDAHGHDVGDLLLIEVADRLKNCVREVDTVARFGGDEFVVILSELCSDKADAGAQASLIADKIRTALAQPYVLALMHEGHVTTLAHHCTASIGVALFVDHEERLDDLFRWADKAMYQAKAAGRNQVRFYPVTSLP